MALNQKRKLRLGNRTMWQGIFAFTTTGTTVTVTVPLGRVESVLLTPLGTPNANEPLSVNNTVSGTAGAEDAGIVGSNGGTALIVTRPVGTTSGLKFSILVIGY